MTSRAVEEEDCPPQPTTTAAPDDPESEAEGEELSDSELESTKRELGAEIAEIEWEFKQLKETLFEERMQQVERKLAELKSGEAPELLKVSKVIEDSYEARKQVCQYF